MRIIFLTEYMSFKNFIYSGIAIVFIVSATPLFVFAAAPSMYFSPATRVVTQGETFSVEVYVDTGGHEVNAAEGEIFFDPDELEVVYISKLDAILTFWAPEPDFSNVNGSIRFGGGSTRNYVGGRGLIAGITFRARVTGSVRVSFRSGALIAADGRGTNIVEQLRGGVYTAIERGIEPIAEGYTAPSGAPDVPVVVSETHADENRWYANNSPRFSWNVPSDTTAVRLGVDQVPGSIPLVEHQPTTYFYKLENLDDGVWYIHIQLKNQAGWGKVGHRRAQIDSQKPHTLEAVIGERSDPTDPRISLRLYAEDGLSGIDFYELQVGGATTVVWRDDGSGMFTFEPLGPGTYPVVIRAVDGAGNVLVNSVDAFIAPIEMPEFTEYPRQLEEDRILTLRGMSIPQTRVVVWVQKEGEEPKTYTVDTDENGRFVYISKERLGDGLYEIWAQSLDSRGARSYATEKIVFTVRDPLVIRLGSKAINVLSVFIPLVALLFALVLVVWYGWHRVIVLRAKVQRELRLAEKTLHVQFELLRQDIQEHLAHLEKIRATRLLTDEERRFIEKFTKHLEKGERAVSQEILKAEHDTERYSD